MMHTSKSTAEWLKIEIIKLLHVLCSSSSLVIVRKILLWSETHSSKFKRIYLQESNGINTERLRECSPRQYCQFSNVIRKTEMCVILLLRNSKLHDVLVHDFNCALDNR